MPFLAIHQLTKRYNARTVVSEVDLSMDEGEILSLLGPSGCGKTTILRMIAGLIKPDGGTITVNGRAFYAAGRELPVEERQIGMVFQDFALWPHMTVGQNIGFGLRLRRQPERAIKERVATLLELVNLSGYEGRYPSQLSGGQQQRVAVARALATQPGLILLDEPLSSLDTGLRAAMRDDLVKLFKQLNITAINVTHDQEEAMLMSDRIMVLHEGRVQQVGTPTELYMEPRSVFVANFMGPINLLRGEANLQSATKNEMSVSAGAITMVGQVSTDLRAHLSGEVALFCRPDDVVVHPADQAPPHNALIGTVTFTAFSAGRWRTFVQVADQPEPFLVYPSFRPLVHENVCLEWPVERCRVVPVNAAAPTEDSHWRA
jgi:ABC-type Fe3+/spermidine/putrescine transport system ATPase subunit